MIFIMIFILFINIVEKWKGNGTKKIRKKEENKEN